MSTLQLLDNPTGGYRFLTGIAPYSSGVVAMPDYEIVHNILREPTPYRVGFEMIDALLSANQRPRQALCAIQLRSPAPFTFDGFAGFNGTYQALLAEWDLQVEGRNPIARTNIAPAVNPPGEPSLYAFSYTIPAENTAQPTFIVAGAGDLRDGDLVPEAIIRPDATSDDAMREKSEYVMSMMKARLDGLQVTWADVTTVDVYTVRSLQPVIAEALLQPMSAAAAHGIRWYYSRPPIQGLEFEMDMRGVRRENIL